MTIQQDEINAHRLKSGQMQAYQRNGYVFPVDVYSEAEARSIRRQLEEVEATIKDEAELLRAMHRRPSWLLPFIDAVVRDPRVVGPVTSILGTDVLAYNAAFFIKEPNSDNFVSWHQDLHYWGFNKAEEVTAWVALSPSTAESGCMRFVPGSHEKDVEHVDTFSDQNMLTRGQELAVAVKEEDAVDVILKAGQMSLHHGHMFHSSGANRSDDRRIGLAIRYITPDMCQVGGERLGASVVSGEDRVGHYEDVPPPCGIFNPQDLDRYRRLISLDHKVKFRGAEQKTDKQITADAAP